jgi:serine protease
MISPQNLKYILTGLLLLLLFPLYADNIKDSENHIPGRVIVKIKKNDVLKSFPADGTFLQNFVPNIESIEQLFPNHHTPLKSLHVSGQQKVDLSMIYQINIPVEQDLFETIDQLYKTGLVEYAEPYFLPHTFASLPNDPFITSQYYLQKIRALEAWSIASGDTNVVIAIVDTGIDLYHPDLTGSIAYNWDDPINGMDSDNDGYIDNFYGWDLGENRNLPQYNTIAHGVHVAGIAGATANNGTGIAGVGLKSRLLPVKVSNLDGQMVKAYEGIVYAADRGAKVINCSWGGPMGAGQFGQDIINYAVLNKDALVIAAAGNSNNDVRIFPASYNNAMSVAATDVNDHKWNNSSYGPLVDISAPGANIFSTWTNGTYISSSGTSLAAPVVSGAAAILRAHFPHYNALQIAAQMKVTADNIDTIAANIPYAGQLGAGRLNLYRALTETHHPFIMLTGLQYSADHYQKFHAGETFDLGAEFQNLLAGAENITAILSTQSPHIDIISGHTLLGNIQSLEKSDNFTSPFTIRVGESMPTSHRVNFTITFYTQDQSFAGKQNFSMLFNLDYLSLHINQIQTTINSRGNIGFNYPEYSQGIGLKYNSANQNRSLIQCAGLVIGTSTSKVVDNIYGPIENSFNGSFSSLQNARMLANPLKGDMQIVGSFNDSLAFSNKLGIKTDYNIYGFTKAPHDKYFVLEYHIINQSEATLNNLYAGYFADWALQDNRNHRAAFDADHNLGYAFSIAGGNFTGLQLLSHSGARHYAFDNQGFNNSIRINDGFTSFEKFTALRSSRNNAGVFDKDNDISTLIGTGPFTLIPGDTLTIAFALMAGDHLKDLQQTALMAYQQYHNPALNAQVESYQTLTQISPNPFTDFFSLGYYLDKSSDVRIRIYNVSGQLTYDFIDKKQPPGLQRKTIETQNWQNGTYLLQITTDTMSETIRIIKQ